MTLGKFSRFECDEYDVLKFSVVSPQIEKIHRAIANEFAADITPSKWSYKPHVTIAYIKKGTNESLDASQFEGRSFTVNQFLYSLPEKKGRVVLTLESNNSLMAVRVSATSLSLRIANLLRASAPSKTSAEHDKVRNAAENHYQGAVNEFVAHAKAEAIKKARRQDTEEAIAVFLMLMIDAQEDGYWNAYGSLEKLEPPLEHITGSELRPEAKEFAESRQEFLAQFPADAYDQLVEVAETARADGQEESLVRKAVAVAAESIRKGRGRILAQTEAQITYGSSELRILKRAGFATIAWNTEDDDKVRPTHAECEAQGPIKLGERFVNGLRFPGDPTGGPAEICNCRCWLTGVERTK
jgi:nicotinamide mononucleotide adenylyltransferase